MVREQAHRLLDELDPAQFDAVAKLLEVMIRDGDDEELTEEDCRAIAASREYFRQNPEGGSVRAGRRRVRFHHGTSTPAHERVGLQVKRIHFRRNVREEVRAVEREAAMQILHRVDRLNGERRAE
jgi:hypothetical protein